MAPLTSLSPPLPHPSPSPAKPRRRPPPPPPPPHFTPSPRGPIRPATIVSAASGVTDGYHSTIRSLNSRGRHVPRKSLGQNYMLNSKVNEELVAAAGVGEGDVVLEIGPGTGSLTDALLAAGATVFAVEKDKHMATLVKDRFGSTERLKIIEEDITKFNVHSHFLPFLEEKSHHSTKHAKVVSNLPFNISTDVVKLLLPMGDVFSIMVLLLQDETALRLADASIQTPEYRPINVFVNFYSEPEYKFKVERTNFFPQPKVDGAVISFKLKNAGEYPPVGSHKSSRRVACPKMRPVFCGNLDYDARQSEIERLFGKYGRVERVDMKSGFAFVYMEEERDADEAIHRLDRVEFGRKGRRLRVEWTKEDRSGGRRGNSKRSPNNTRPTKTLFVINFDPINTRTRDLERHFDQYGKISNVRIRRNFAFVQYELQEDATKALEGTNGSTLLDRVISVEYALRDDDEKRNGYSPDRRGRDRSPDRREYRGRSASPYGRGRERGSPDYGRGRERGSPDYGRGGDRGSPNYGRGASPQGGNRVDERVSPPKYDRERREASPGYDRPRSRSPARYERE
uniref:rRNA adenine N(6)-methyltransferase n=2 Tax=Leersia perrieri TaxID=77586 RepID=A0A0D9VBJ5_9ORYZ